MHTAEILLPNASFITKYEEHHEAFPKVSNDFQMFNLAKNIFPPLTKGLQDASGAVENCPAAVVVSVNFAHVNLVAWL